MTDPNTVKARVLVNDHWRNESFIKKLNISFTCDMSLPMCEFGNDILFTTTTLFKRVKNECIKRSGLTDEFKEDKDRSLWQGTVHEFEWTQGYRSIKIEMKILPRASMVMAVLLLSHSSPRLSFTAATIPRSIMRNFDGYSCYDKMYDYQRDHKLAEWKDVLMIEQKFDWSLHIACDDHGFYCENDIPNYNYNHTLSHETATSQKYILDGISEDSIEWNDFDMALYEYCDIWAKLFVESKFCLIIFAMMQCLEFCYANILGFDSPRMEKTVGHLKYLVTNNNGMYNSLPFDNIKSIPYDVQDYTIQYINQIHMQCKLIQELQSLPSIGYYILTFCVGMAEPKSDNELIEFYHENGIKLGHKSINLEILTNVANFVMTAVARKHGRILKYLFSARIRNIFDKGHSLRLQLINGSNNLHERLINCVIEMFFMLCLWVRPVSVEKINRMEFILTQVLSKSGQIRVSPNTSNENTIRLYNALVLKLKLQKLQVTYDTDDFVKFLVDIQPFYDYFVKHNLLLFQHQLEVSIGL